MTESYQDENNLSFQSAALKENRHGWKKTLALLPAVSASMVPGITCPACWPGYAGLGRS